MATILSLLFVPVLYLIIKTLEDRFLKHKRANQSKPPASNADEDEQSRAMPSLREACLRHATRTPTATSSTNAHQHSSVIVKQNANDNRPNDSSH